MNPYVRKVFLPLIAIVLLSGALFTAEAHGYAIIFLFSKILK